MGDPTLSVCNDIHSCRTFTNLVWSCLTTIFACTWTAIHRNIPASRKGKLSGILETGKIIVVALLVPEWVLAWAIRQFLNARAVGKALEDARTEARNTWGAKRKAFLGKGYLGNEDEPQIDAEKFQHGRTESQNRSDDSRTGNEESESGGGEPKIGNEEPPSTGTESQIGNEEPPSTGTEPQIGNDDSQIRDESQAVEDVPECGDDESDKARLPSQYRSLAIPEASSPLLSQREARELSLERVEAIAHHLERNRTSGTLEDLVTEGENGRLDESESSMLSRFAM
jgi:hypothetical protein